MSSGARVQFSRLSAPRAFEELVAVVLFESAKRAFDTPPIDLAYLNTAAVTHHKTYYGPPASMNYRR